MSAGTLAVLLIFGSIFAAIVGGIFLKALKVWKGISPEQNQERQAEETKLIQELYRGFAKLEERVEALETILLDRRRKEDHT
jgi:phage shock protein B